MNKNDVTYGGAEPKRDDVQSSGLPAEGQRETRQIEQGIAHTRAEMSGTLEEIHGKLNPTALKEQAVDQFQEAKQRIKAEIKAELADAKAAVRGATVGRVQRAVRSTTETVKRNPVPSAMVGVGMAWLIVRSRSRNGRAYDYVAPELDVTDEPGVRAQQTGEELRASARELGDEVRRRAERTRQAAGARAHAAGERMQRLRQDAQERGRQLEYRARSTFEENPLLVGAAVVAAGALLGLSIPISRRETELMGRTRDQLMERAQVKVQGALDKAQGVARRIEDDLTRSGGRPPSTTR